MLDKFVFAMSQRPSGGAETSAGPASAFVNLFPIIMIFGIFYFLLIRPQQKKQKEHQNMLGNIKKGDNVLTTGGIFGIVVGVKDKAFTVKIADNVKVDISKTAVSSVFNKKDEIESK